MAAKKKKAARKPKRDLYAEVTDKIIAALEAGTIPWCQPWDPRANGGREGFTRFRSGPFNGATGRAYNGINVLLLTIEEMGNGYPTSRWMTYRQASALGGQVRKGEKSTLVVYWKIIDKKDKETGETKKLFFLRHFNVFNVAQIDDLDEKKLKEAPAPEFVPEIPVSWKNDGDRNESIEAFIKATGATVREDEREGRAFYSPVGDFIGMPDIRKFEDTGAFYSTLLHEITHWTGAEKRCAREFGKRFGDEAYAFEELVAEMGSAFLCARFGLEGKLQHPEYIAHWIKVLKSDKKAVLTAASQAKKATKFLKELVESNEEVAASAAA